MYQAILSVPKLGRLLQHQTQSKSYKLSQAYLTNFLCFKNDPAALQHPIKSHALPHIIGVKMKNTICTCQPML